VAAGEETEREVAVVESGGAGCFLVPATVDIAGWSVVTAADGEWVAVVGVVVTDLVIAGTAVDGGTATAGVITTGGGDDGAVCAPA
jgi:hypothetical protein